MDQYASISDGEYWLNADREIQWNIGSAFLLEMRAKGQFSRNVSLQYFVKPRYAFF